MQEGTNPRRDTSTTAWGFDTGTNSCMEYCSYGDLENQKVLRHGDVDALKHSGIETQKVQ